MSELPIPAASLTRLRQAYQQFLDLASVVSDAMGIPPETQRQLQLDRGVFVLEDGRPPTTDAARINGVAEGQTHG